MMFGDVYVILQKLYYTSISVGKLVLQVKLILKILFPHLCDRRLTYHLYHVT